MISPFVLKVSKEYEDYGALSFDPKEMNIIEFMQWYFGEGLTCLFQLDNENDRCQYSFVFLIGYVVSLFVLQITLTYLMQMKKAKNARMIFAFMVPITVGAFFMGAVTNPSLISLSQVDALDIVSTPKKFLFKAFFV